MLKRVGDVKESLCLYAAASSKIPLLDNAEWTTLSNCVAAIEPYEEITKRMSSGTASISDIIPLIKSLKNALQSGNEATLSSSSSSDFSKGIRTMKRTMLNELEMRFSSLESNI
jgi:hypothetical protein